MIKNSGLIKDSGVIKDNEPTSRMLCSKKTNDIHFTPARHHAMTDGLKRSCYVRMRSFTLIPIH